MRRCFSGGCGRWCFPALRFGSLGCFGGSLGCLFGAFGAGAFGRSAFGFDPVSFSGCTGWGWSVGPLVGGGHGGVGLLTWWC